MPREIYHKTETIKHNYHQKKNLYLTPLILLLNKYLLLLNIQGFMLSHFNITAEVPQFLRDTNDGQEAEGSSMVHSGPQSQRLFWGSPY